MNAQESASLDSIAAEPVRRTVSRAAKLRSLAGSLLRPVIEAQRAQVEWVVSVFDCLGFVPARETPQFEEQVDRHLKLRLFTRRLERETAEREAVAFRDQVTAYVRRAEFTERLVQQREASFADLVRRYRWHLYGRD